MDGLEGSDSYEFILRKEQHPLDIFLSIVTKVVASLISAFIIGLVKSKKK